MLKKLQTAKWCISLTGTLIAAAPLLGLALFVYITVTRQLEVLSSEQQQALAYTAATILDEKLRGEIAFEKSYASRAYLVQSVLSGDRKEMRRHLQDLVETSNNMERAAITSPKGILLADYPAASGSSDRDYSRRNWYRGVSQSWTPYVSEFFQKDAPSRQNVFAIAVPVRSNGGLVIGILVMQPRADFVRSVLDRIKQTRGTTYLVDNKGTVVYHPGLDREKTINIASSTVVAKVMQGLKGTEKWHDPLTGKPVIGAYHPVDINGWGVITQIPLTEVLAPVENVIRGICLFTAIMLLISAWLAYRRSELIFSRKKASDELMREDTINKAYGDVLTLINHDWLSVEDLAQAALQQLDNHVSILAGACYLVEERGLVPLTVTGAALPAEAGGITRAAMERNEVVRLLAIPPDSVLTVSTAVGSILPREIIAVPLSVKSQVVAVLELASLYGFEETDLRIINRIVPQLAIGINTIRSGLVQKALLVERNRLFNLSLDMICISGFDGYFKQLNPAWEKNLGWSSDELMAIPFLDIVHPEDREATARAAQGLVAGQALNNFENRYRCADGSYIWISLNSYPLVEEELIFSMARDVTVQKKLEQEISERSTQVETANFELHTINEESQTLNESLQILNEQLKVQQIENIESNRRLAEVSQTKSDFLANMSHELRTPLNSVIGFSEVLQDQMFGQINQKQQEYVSNILTSGKHLLSLINDILDLSKVESGKMVLEMGDFSLRESLDASLMMLKEKALKAGIELNLELAPQADIRIVADQRKIKQILFNLLSNAVKFTPAGGTICVSAVRDGDFIEITVADSGMGIRPEDISKLFKAFTQLESVYTKGFEGTGLGLALTRQLVELHGGRVWVKSDFGAGSRFSFTLPLAPAVIVSSPTGPQAADSTATVLLIEDDPLTLSSIGRALQSKGHVTLLAANGEEGVRIAQRELPDLIILDLVMPGMSGFEVIKQLHNLKATAGIPVLILTEMDLSGADRSRLTGKVWRIEEKRSLSTQELNSLVERAVESNKRTR